jgi:hypothetical protein
LKAADMERTSTMMVVGNLIVAGTTASSPNAGVPWPPRSMATHHAARGLRGVAKEKRELIQEAFGWSNDR